MSLAELFPLLPVPFVSKWFQGEPLIIKDDSNGESDNEAEVRVALSDLLASIKD
ncbi:hypothetical protein VE02_09780 [Pseudogymnoascus sp. 03VT05]|nr:hypothetical protein VE02_09780 [Pseudogymnoascus sp. 03VT05]